MEHLNHYQQSTEDRVIQSNKHHLRLIQTNEVVQVGVEEKGG